MTHRVDDPSNRATGTTVAKTLGLDGSVEGVAGKLLETPVFSRGQFANGHGYEIDSK